MLGWLRSSPGLIRAAALALAAVAVVAAGHLSGAPLDWGIAIVYGTAMAVSMRWPIVMPSTGARVVLITGMLTAALWQHGFLTALMVLVVEFGLRMLVLYHGRYYWEWFRPLLVGTAFSVAYGVQLVMESSSVIGRHGELPAFAMAYAFWVLLNMGWIVVKAQRHGRTRTQELMRVLQQTWWVPLSFMAVAWPLQLVHNLRYPIEIPVCMVLVYVQSVVGPVFTTLSQDRAVGLVLRSNPSQTPQQRFTVHRVLRTSHAIGRTLGLSPHELRQIGYAALLQETPGVTKEPLWLMQAPDAEQRQALSRQAEESMPRVEADGSLQEVARLIAFRYADYNGKGVPAVGGEAIPLAAQVLIAANAMVYLMSEESGLRLTTSADAVAWLQTHAGDRFSPRLLAAMSQAFYEMDPVVNVERGMPEAVAQLRSLVSESDSPSLTWVGLRRIWAQLRGHTGLAPDLPPEVQAVAKLATYFASSTQADQVAQITVEAVGQLMGGKVLLAVREGEASELLLKFRAAYGMHMVDLVGRSLDLFTGVLTRAMLDQVPVQLSDLREIGHPIAQEVGTVEGIRSSLFVPLVHRGRAIGLLLIGLQRQHWFTPQEVGLIHLMAGQAAAALENARLITEAAERLEHISELKAFTDTMLDNLSQSIVVVEPQGKLVMANAATRTRFGGDFELLIGQPLPPELASIAQIDRALDGETSPEEDVAWGNSILEVQSAPLIDTRGSMLGAICVARDVTQVRTMEQHVRRVEKLAAIGELAAGAAHEIRNPLTSIRGFIQLLQARASRGDGEYFQIILNEIDRIDWIIRDMLLLARPTEVSLQDTDLPALLNQLVLMHQADLQRQNIRVAHEYDPAIRQVSVDPKMFRQLLLNLMLNAMQAMPYGGTLGLVLRRTRSDELALAVSDTGVGISPENLKRLFVPFFTTKEEGTGLGLALCYSIVQAHGGRIDVESQVGLGTTFTITLPLKQGSTAAAR